MLDIIQSCGIIAMVSTFVDACQSVSKKKWSFRCPCTKIATRMHPGRALYTSCPTEIDADPSLSGFRRICRTSPVSECVVQSKHSLVH